VNSDNVGRATRHYAQATGVDASVAKIATARTVDAAFSKLRLLLCVVAVVVLIYEVMFLFCC
jgi:hypothetical protein